MELKRNVKIRAVTAKLNVTIFLFSQNKEPSLRYMQDLKEKKMLIVKCCRHSESENQTEDVQKIDFLYFMHTSRVMNYYYYNYYFPPNCKTHSFRCFLIYETNICTNTKSFTKQVKVP